MKTAGIIGSGAVGKVLAAGLTGLGMDVMVGSRDPQKLSEWKTKQQPSVRIGDFASTAAFGEMLVLAVKGTAALEALRMCATADLDGKVVIDATNPIAAVPPEKGVLFFTTRLDLSQMEDLQAAFPAVRFVKAFNSVGSAVMVNPDFGGITPTMFICGNDREAKSIVAGILESFGWEPEDLGDAIAARAIEPLCILWCIPGFLHNSWSHAFKLLKQ